MTENDWTVHLARCSDNSLYCGITNDLSKRLAEHNSGKGVHPQSGAFTNNLSQQDHIPTTKEFYQYKLRLPFGGLRRAKMLPHEIDMKLHISKLYR